MFILYFYIFRMSSFFLFFSTSLNRRPYLSLLGHTMKKLILSITKALQVTACMYVCVHWIKLSQSKKDLMKVNVQLYSLMTVRKS